jgi:hypothetical protein
MAAQGGGGCGAPYAGVAVELTAAPEADASKFKTVLNLNAAATAHEPWIRPLACYERREAHEFEMSRFG